MVNLLDITDDSDPLNITKGNPGLKPSFSNELRLFYNNFIADKQMSYMTHVWYNNTMNSISNKVSYDSTTGVKTTQPMNINGNWSTGIFGNFNTPLDHAKKLTINTFTTLSYTNNVSYIDSTLYNAGKSKTRQFNASERLSLGYRTDWWDVEANGSINYQNSRNNVISSNNLNTYTFSYGFAANVTLPWGTSLSTDMSMNSRRGYSQSSMNTNELLWNVQVSQSFLKGKPLTISFQAYDILGQQSNISRTINSIMRSDTWSNAINQYCMLHVIYKLNIFGSKEAREGMGGPGGFGPGGFGGGPGGGRPGGGRPGGGPR